MNNRPWSIGVVGCLALLLFAAPVPSAAQAKGRVLAAAEAKDHVGESASVTGVVEQVSTSSRGTEFMNFDGKYPDAPFTVVVFAADAAAVGDLSKYQGKRVTVTGKIVLFHGTPEIVVKDPEALAVAR